MGDYNIKLIFKHRVGCGLGISAVIYESGNKPSGYAKHWNG